MEEVDTEDTLFRLTSLGVVTNENVLVLDVDEVDGIAVSGVLKGTLILALSGSGNFGTESIESAAPVDNLYRWQKADINF